MGDFRNYFPLHTRKPFARTTLIRIASRRVRGYIVGTYPVSIAATNSFQLLKAVTTRVSRFRVSIFVVSGSGFVLYTHNIGHLPEIVNVISGRFPGLFFSLDIGLTTK